MIIRKYGIELHRLTHDDIELVRQARNRDDIRKNMFDQHYISKAEQEVWFRSINNVFNYYYLIKGDGEKVGLVYGKNQDFQKRTSEGGIFIWGQQPNTPLIAARASILLMEFNFSIIQMERVFARVRPENKSAYNYNLALGYEPTGTDDYMVLTRASYEKNISRLRKIASGKKQSTPLSMDDIDLSNVSENNYLYQDIPEDILEIIATKFSGGLQELKRILDIHRQR